MNTVFWGLLIPFIGTAAGAACVFFLKKDLRSGVQRALTGFAAGVMVAASIWSLIVPAIEQSADKGRWAFLPAGNPFPAAAGSRHPASAQEHRPGGSDGRPKVQSEPDDHDGAGGDAA